ncbi:MAG: YafY family transcriptional regulator [Anaerolineales bacterium]|nr:YafY family transcriptional regulator [Anaerolineales bacterium]
MANVATRLITLILTLQNRPHQKAAGLADKLGVSVRTLHRYFEMLEEMGIPIYAERGPYGGFSLVRGYKLPPLVFSMEEAIAVYMGTNLVSETWGELYRDAAQGAMAKIENILPNEQRDEINWARRSLVTTNLYRADLASLSPLMEKLRYATRERRQVSMVYQNQVDSKPGKRKINPYVLLFRSGWWYVVGYCHLRTALRTFRVDRIQKMTVLDQTFVMPDDFDIHAYLEKEFKSQPAVRARLRFIPEAAHMVTGNRSMWESIKENPDGSMDATLTAPDMHWLASMTLSFANWVIVLEPQELRVMVQEWAQSIVAQYAE